MNENVLNILINPKNTLCVFTKEDLERSIVSRFEQQVQQHPHRLAVKTYEDRFTYEQLNQAANRLARSILAQCGEGDELIPILFEHGAMMVVAMLGVLKAGKSWVPIDPWYPPARIDYILKTCQASLLVTNHRNLPLVQDTLADRCQVINLDEIDVSLSDENLGLTISPDAIACVLPTSGSTGEPKGVVHNHRNFLHVCMRWTNAYRICLEDRLLLLNSYCHIGGINNIFSAVLNGAAVYPYSLKEISLTNLVDWLITEEITIYHSVSTVFRHFINSLNVDRKFPKLRLIHLGGESVFKRDFELYKEHFAADCIFLNSFGCTEISSYRQYFIDQSTQVTSNIIPIGYAAEDTEVLLLDDRGEPVGDNTIGEIFIKSEYLALGYWQRPDLDALSFLPDPTDGNQRIYRTGDLGRMSPDGCLMHLGRKDFQIKIRGYRIELSECEAVLSEYPGIKEVAVIARYSSEEIARAERELEQSAIAYVVPHSTKTVSSKILYEFLQEKLPSYLIPAGFIFLDALPLNANGKIDRRALPKPQDADVYSSSTYLAPRTPLELQLAEVWAEVLKLDRVGISDNFFELGGHSLLAGQLGLRIESSLQVTVSPQQILTTPTIAGLAAALSQSQTKQMGIPRRSAEIQFTTLSFAQQRLWYLEQLDPGRTDYHLSTAVRLTGELNLAALQQSLDAIVAHHEGLRTNFISDQYSPLQTIRSPRQVELLVLDLQSYPQPQRDLEIDRRLQQESLRTFDLERDLMLRGCVLQLGTQEQILLLVMHHIAFDGWSMGILTAQLQELYPAYCSGRTPNLPALPIQYADFALWQRQYLQGEVLDSALAYWQQQMAGAPALLSLPTDRPRPAIQTFRGGSRSFTLDRDLTSALSRLSRQSGVTLFMTLLAAFDTLLYRYTGSEDLVVGAPIASRNRRELVGLIGFFANTLVLRTDVSGNPSFLEVLERVKQLAVEAYSHQDLPFDLLVEELQPQRDLSYSPIFQVMFAFEEDVAPRQLELPNLITSPYPLDKQIAQFDLTLCLEKQAEGLVGRWEYNTDLFDPITIERLAGHFQILLEGIVANPHQPISQLPILTAAERDRLLVAWNDTQTPYQQDRCIHQLFEEQVELYPDAVAVAFERQQLTYRELNSRANQLAHHLRALGVKADVLVGISVERSLDMVVGILGILKAGGAYVPLDPAYPQERLALIVEDAAISVLLTQSHLIDRLPEHQARVVCIDTDLSDSEDRQYEQNLTTEVAPHHLAYVIYTSGSTGTPKGVLIEHRSLVNYTTAVKNEYEATPLDRILQFTSLNFDISAEEIYTCLTAGATLVLRTEDTIEIGTFCQQCRDWNITLVSLPTAYWHELTSWMETDLFALPHSLRLVIIGGEQVAPARFRAWQKVVGAQVRLVNTYGPTEATISVLMSDLTELAQDACTQEVSIGRPIANIQAYILDLNLQPVPIGVPGELHIGGSGLARGYLNRPDLTAEKFIPNPLIDVNHSAPLLYKTGDLTRYRADGNIEYLGRIDNQVKIRGFRIELGEIEALLGQHPAVSQIVVVVREDSPGDKRLIAYCIIDRDPPPTISELRNFISQKVPNYMVPSTFVVLDSLPLTPNGKIDRRALPAPGASNTQFDAEFVSPSNPSEEILATIWANVLNVEQVGISDNFFDLGGHSLLATQVISRIRQAFSIEIPLKSLFEKPTIASLAQTIAQHQNQGADLSEHKTISPRANREYAPLSFAQQRLWFLDQLEPNSPFYNIPMAVRLKGELNMQILQQALDAIVAHHEILRTNYISQNGHPIQVITAPKSVELQIIDLDQYGETERETQIQKFLQQERKRPFNLAEDMMLRACLLQLAPQEHILILVIHHIASDGWSMGILWDQLTHLYQSFLAGQPNPLPPLLIQYADYAVWQREWLTGEVLDKQLNYWQQQLAGANPLLELPTDRPRPATQTYRGASQAFTLPESLINGIKLLCRQEGVTLYMTLLAALQILLYRYSRQEDILVGAPIAGRSHAKIEGLIGFFVNTLVLRTDLSGNPSFQELLIKVRSVTLDAYNHQDLPFQKLVEELQPERSLSYNPLFQVMFVLQNVPEQAGQMPGLTETPVHLEAKTAKFDLTLFASEQDGVIVGEWEYNADLFDTATIERMMVHFQTLLEGIVANPQQQIDQLPMLTQAERHQLLVEWNETSTEYPQDKCIHHLFEEQVERTPDAVALVFNGEQLTYRELNIRANQLAHHLKTLGVTTDVCVGISVQRSVEMLVGILGILKAGGAYVPLDPTYPQERLQEIVVDTQLSVILTQQLLLDRLPPHQAQIVVLDLDEPILARQSTDNLANTSGSMDLAYVMYTSGSTGRAKGVSVIHRGVVRLVKEIDYASFTANDVSIQIAPISFDASTLEIWGALLNGGKLVIFPPHQLTLAELGQIIARHQVSTMWLTAGLFNVIVDTQIEILAPLRQLLAGGDVLSVQHVQKFLNTFPNCQLINGYGPTENTTFTACYPITAPLKPGASIPLGRPISNTQVYILDGYSQLVPKGVPGELCVGGDGLARDYFKRPELTAEKFISHPFNPDPAARLYRTGDLARYLPNGNIEFLGRIDNQVKINGFRIELGEIETLLSQHPAIAQSTVIIREDRPGDKRLVAYYVATDPDSPPTVDLLRDFIAHKVPSFMVPGVFVRLAALPMTVNSKIDRRSLPLPVPDSLGAEHKDTFIAPRNELETQLTKIWGKVLGLQSIGIRDNFFELGGHSLLAVRLLSEIQNNLGHNLPLSLLFTVQNIEQLAQILAPVNKAISWSSLVPIQTVGSKPPLFCIHAIWGNVLFYKELVGYLESDQPCYGLQAQGLDGQRVPSTSIVEMAAHYIQEIQSVQPQGPYAICGSSFGGVVAFEVARQLHERGEKIALLAIFDSPAPTATSVTDGAALLDLSRQLLVHLRIWMKLKFSDKLTYVWHRLEWHLTGGKARLFYEFYLRYLRRSPADLRILNVGLANRQALQSYCPIVYPGSLTLFRAKEELLEEFNLSADLGWSELATGKVDIYEVPGKHDTMMHEPHVRVLAEQLTACLKPAATSIDLEGQY